MKRKKSRSSGTGAGANNRISLACSLVLNALIFVFTVYSLFLCFYNTETGEFTADGLRAFRFFTVDSNIFCALASLLLIVTDLRLLSKNGGPLPEWLLIFKYMGTAAVTLTLLTCVFYLSGMTGGFGNLIHGKELFMHLLTPLAAALSFVVFEHGAVLPLWTVFLPLIPVAVYGAVYFYYVLAVPKDYGGWQDFYGFVHNRDWYTAVLVMFAATLLICLVLWALNRLFYFIQTGRKRGVK